MARSYVLILDSVKRAIRSPYAWPGGYPVYVILADGGRLCADCARENFRSIVRETIDPHFGWEAFGAEILYESEDSEQCGHCCRELETAYE